MVQELCGYKQIVLIADVAGLQDNTGNEHANHALLPYRWNWSDNTLQCQNSWGTDDFPAVAVSESMFVCAYVVDAVIDMCYFPGENHRTHETKFSGQPSKEWQHAHKRLRLL